MIYRLSKSIRVVLHTGNSHFTSIRSSFFLCRRYVQLMQWQIFKKNCDYFFSDNNKPIFSLSSPKSTIVAASSGVPAYDWDSFFIFELFTFSGKYKISYILCCTRKKTVLNSARTFTAFVMDSIIAACFFAFIASKRFIVDASN